MANKEDDFAEKMKKGLRKAKEDVEKKGGVGDGHVSFPSGGGLSRKSLHVAIDTMLDSLGVAADGEASAFVVAIAADSIVKGKKGSDVLMGGTIHDPFAGMVIAERMTFTALPEMALGAMKRRGVSPVKAADMILKAGLMVPFAEKAAQLLGIPGGLAAAQEDHCPVHGFDGCPEDGGESAQGDGGAEGWAADDSEVMRQLGILPFKPRKKPPVM